MMIWTNLIPKVKMILSKKKVESNKTKKSKIQQLMKQPQMTLKLLVNELKRYIEMKKLLEIGIKRWMKNNHEKNLTTSNFLNFFKMNSL